MPQRQQNNNTHRTQHTIALNTHYTYIYYSWRKLIAKAEAPPKKKKADDPPPPKMTHASAFVAERFGGWQEVALRALASSYDAEKKAFAADAFGAAQAAVKAAADAGADPALAGLNDKQLKALAMPFVKFKVEEATKAGSGAVLDVKLPFDEAALLRDNEAYLLRALGLKSLSVHSATDAAAAAAAGADVGNAYPAAPIVMFAPAPPAAAAAAAAAAAPVPAMAAV